MQIYIFACCARTYETWKQCQSIMRTLTCKHKIWGGNWLYLRPYLKAFPVFNVLKTCREYFLTTDLGIVEFIQKFIERFLENAKFLGMDQITSKNCIKSSWMQCKLIKFFLLAIAHSNSPLFCMQFSMESNHYKMKPRSQSLSFSLKN